MTLHTFTYKISLVRGLLGDYESLFGIIIIITHMRVDLKKEKKTKKNLVL